MRRMTKRKGKIIIPAGRAPWAHEMRVAEVLAAAEHVVEFLPERMVKTADILVDGVEFEIKSPLTNKVNTLEHNLKRALKQSSNIIIDISRMDGRKMPEAKVKSFLLLKCKQHPQIKRMLLITKAKRIVDIRNYSDTMKALELSTEQYVPTARLLFVWVYLEEIGHSKGENGTAGYPESSE